MQNLSEVFKVGDEVEALVVRVDAAEQKIALSMRAILEREERAAIKRVAAQSGTQKATLGDLFSQDALSRLRGGGGSSGSNE